MMQAAQDPQFITAEIPGCGVLSIERALQVTGPGCTTSSIHDVIVRRSDLTPLLGDATHELLDTAAMMTHDDPPKLIRSGDGRLFRLTQSAVNDRCQTTIRQVPNEPDALIEEINRLAAVTHVQQASLAVASETVVSQQEQLSAYAAQVSEDLEELTWLRSLANNLELSESGNSTERIAESVLPSLCRLMRAATLVFIRDTPVAHLEETLPVILQTGEETVDEWIPLRLAELAVDVKPDRPVVKNSCHGKIGDESIPGLDSCILVPVATTTARVGWLVAINKAKRPSPHWIDGFGPVSGTNMSEHEFGTFEASLMGATAVVLAAHGRNCTLFHEKERLLKGVIRSLVNAIDAKDSYTCGHSDRVAEYARLIAEEMRLDAETCETIYMTGLLHDIGKIGVPDGVLNKNEKLTEEEFELIKQHPVIGYEILKHLQNFSYVLPGVLHHHEEFDGAGYPHGLAGTDIPETARILAVADAYDAMTSNRPYRNGMPTARAEQILRDGDGQQWDPNCIKAFFAVLNDVHSIANRKDSPSGQLQLTEEFA
jgi:HD-GYP domain-containing protein (c-di-GMP phosphodiesterase class II)